MGYRVTKLPTSGPDVIIDFDDVGDVFPVHVHADADNHVTMVLRGRFQALGHESLAGLMYGPGAVIDWKAHTPHGFRALEPKTRIVNIAKVRR